VLAKPFTLSELRRVLLELEEGTTETQQQGWPGYVAEAGLSA